MFSHSPPLEPIGAHDQKWLAISRVHGTKTKKHGARKDAQSISANFCLFKTLPNAMWSPKTVSNRAQNTATILSDLLFSLGFFIYVLVFWGALIIPKWLILIPGHIAILVGWFLELPKIRSNLALGPHTYHQNISKIQERYGSNSLETYFHIWESEILNLLEGLCTYFLILGNFQILKFQCIN